MADVDNAPLRYRAPVEVWWWLEKRSTGMLHRHAHRVEESGYEGGDPYDLNPKLIEWFASVAYVQRKAAERRAITYLRRQRC